MAKVNSPIPLYDFSDLSALLHNWHSGGLDGICSPNPVAIGIEDCDRVSHGLRPMSLLERFTSSQVSGIFQSFAESHEPYPLMGAVLYLVGVRKLSIEMLARALEVSCAEAHSLVLRSQDEFMRNLLHG